MSCGTPVVHFSVISTMPFDKNNFDINSKAKGRAQQPNTYASSALATSIEKYQLSNQCNLIKNSTIQIPGAVVGASVMSVKDGNITTSGTPVYIPTQGIGLSAPASAQSEVKVNVRVKVQSHANATGQPTFTIVPTD